MAYHKDMEKIGITRASYSTGNGIWVDLSPGYLIYGNEPFTMEYKPVEDIEYADYEIVEPLQLQEPKTEEG